MLVECADAATGETRYVICAVGRGDGDYMLTPFGHLAPGNPYDAYVPPTELAGPATGFGREEEGGREWVEPAGLQRERPVGLAPPALLDIRP